MLQIDIIAVGKLKERFWKEACDEYLKRLKAHAKISVRELPDSSPEREAGLIAQALPGGSYSILLDIGGKQASSEQLAAHIEELALRGRSHLAFVIGGSEGVAHSIVQQTDERLSFGPITLPHNLARVVLLEQLYRAFKINSGEPYHK